MFLQRLGVVNQLGSVRLAPSGQSQDGTGRNFWNIVVYRLCLYHRTSTYTILRLRDKSYLDTFFLGGRDRSIHLKGFLSRKGFLESLRTLLDKTPHWRVLSFSAFLYIRCCDV
ncbi:hypothetical protein DPEC_G00312200 [Dallia pectoralis]|uniref:Uncharacterized protein n=1 Tax=Dallia pectoralis TaxID=75939 RepID=A0ACC2FBV4_DALPE|nr:hypothetical protein DPEC_G00312200 [Dallia pectoralis]